MTTIDNNDLIGLSTYFDRQYQVDHVWMEMVLTFSLKSYRLSFKYIYL